ncbi:hypothetical protein CPSG_07693 [Coccidioides posadasii str. Silveira]|uniref:Uncharacterized protein n=1 Tax=Coccidioides posadasii (strain RMSCC 757 / Silveira) TaxID=443226 RepID=E9DDQ0_COCPS|nr:hypothetical protein CPSG_07693 [Coccidioides posadasii str. Silveira]
MQSIPKKKKRSFSLIERIPCVPFSVCSPPPPPPPTRIAHRPARLNVPVQQQVASQLHGATTSGLDMTSSKGVCLIPGFEQTRARKIAVNEHPRTMRKKGSQVGDMYIIICPQGRARVESATPEKLGQSPCVHPVFVFQTYVSLQHFVCLPILKCHRHSLLASFKPPPLFPAISEYQCGPRGGAI